MDLVVACRALAISAVHSRRCGNPAISSRTQGNRSAHDPHAQFRCGVRQEILNRARPVAFGDVAFVGVTETHEREVLGKCGKLRTELRGLFEVDPRLREIGFHVRAGRHLNCGNFHRSLNLLTPRPAHPTSPAIAAARGGARHPSPQTAPGASAMPPRPAA